MSKQWGRLLLLFYLLPVSSRLFVRKYWWIQRKQPKQIGPTYPLWNHLPGEKTRCLHQIRYRKPVSILVKDKLKMELEFIYTSFILVSGHSSTKDTNWAPCKSLTEISGRISASFWPVREIWWQICDFVFIENSIVKFRVSCVCMYEFKMKIESIF